MEFDKDTDEFLDALKEGTMKVYRAGLANFQSYYGKTPKCFLDALEEDQQKPRREKKRVSRNTLKGFVEWLQEKDLAPKTIRAYIAAVQSFAGYHGIVITTRYVNLPAAVPVSEKFAWTLETVTKLIDMIQDLELKSVAVNLFQSGISIVDLRLLTYSDIKYEYENGIVPLCFDTSRHKNRAFTPFMTFIGSWGVKLLRQHLKGRKLKLDTPLYQINHRTLDDQFQLLAKEFVGKYKGFNPIRPHTLRAAFRTLLGDEGCSDQQVKFWMGQTLPEQDRVYHSRSREGWRKQYVKYEFALTPENWK